jgi:hypothetical protein
MKDNPETPSAINDNVDIMSILEMYSKRKKGTKKQRNMKSQNTDYHFDLNEFLFRHPEYKILFCD